MLLFQAFIPTGAKKGRSLISEIEDLKEFKKWLKTKTNLLVVFAKSGEQIVPQIHLKQGTPSTDYNNTDSSQQSCPLLDLLLYVFILIFYCYNEYNHSVFFVLASFSSCAYPYADPYPQLNKISQKACFHTSAYHHSFFFPNLTSEGTSCVTKAEECNHFLNITAAMVHVQKKKGKHRWWACEITRNWLIYGTFLSPCESLCNVFPNIYSNRRVSVILTMLFI